MYTFDPYASETLAVRLIHARLPVGLMPTRFERTAIGVVSAVAMIALSVVAVLAQQPPPPQQQAPAMPSAPAAAPPPAASPSPQSPSPAIASWQQSLVAHLARFQRYPPQARGAQGVVTVAFRIDRQGNVVSSRIAKSSGSAVLDADALAMIKRAAPLPPPPAGIADDDLSIVVPIRYSPT